MIKCRSGSKVFLIGLKVMNPLVVLNIIVGKTK